MPIGRFARASPLVMAGQQKCTVTRLYRRFTCVRTHGFVRRDSRTSVAHPLARPSDRLRRGSLRKAFAFLRCISARLALLLISRHVYEISSFQLISPAKLILAYHQWGLTLTPPSGLAINPTAATAGFCFKYQRTKITNPLGKGYSPSLRFTSLRPAYAPSANTNLSEARFAGFDATFHLTSAEFLSSTRSPTLT